MHFIAPVNGQELTEVDIADVDHLTVANIEVLAAALSA
jgi:hypothetical protein